MLDEVKKLIDELDEFQSASFWSEMNIAVPAKRRVDKEIVKIKKILIEEGLL